MEKLDSVLCQLIVLYTHLNFQLSYLQLFYKTNKIEIKSSTKVKTYF